jgi:hypothetical protein
VRLLLLVLAGHLLLNGAAVWAASDTAWVTIQFMAPGDDGMSGRAAAYDLRFADFAINGTNWASATRVSVALPAPQLAGSQQSVQLVIPDVVVGKRYHFALRTRDEVFNWSPVSNSASFEFDNLPSEHSVVEVR